MYVLAILLVTDCSNSEQFVGFLLTNPGEKYAHRIVQRFPTGPGIRISPLTSQLAHPRHWLWDHSKAPRISRHRTNSLAHRLILESLKFCQLWGKWWGARLTTSKGGNYSVSISRWESGNHGPSPSDAVRKNINLILSWNSISWP